MHLSLFVVAVTALASHVNAQGTFQFKNKYPSALWDAKLGHIPIPDTTTPQVKAWVAAINMSAIPNIPPATTKNNDGYTLNFTPAMKDYCDWSYDPTVENTCASSDVFECPTVGDWGLSFDDGPTEYSPILYDYLDSINQKATLFFIGASVYNYPLYAQRACKAMHHIGLHTWTHHLLTTLTNEQIVAEMKYSEMIIKEVCGFTPKHMRPPFGDADARVRALMKAMGYLPIIWDYDTNDWNLPPAVGSTTTIAMVDKDFTTWIANRPKDTKGHICLEHELYNTSIAEAIKWIPQLKKAYNVVPVQACIREPYPYQEQQYVFPVVDAAGINLINSTQLPANSTTSNTTAAANSTASSPASVTASVPASNSSAPATTTGATTPSGASTTTISVVLSALSIVMAFTYMNM